MNKIEELLRMKYLLPDEEDFEPAANLMRHLTATEIMNEIISQTDDYPHMSNKLLNEIRNELDRLKVRNYDTKKNGHYLRLYKVLNKGL